MSHLADLLNLPGAMASFAFRGNGEVIETNIGNREFFDQETLSLLAHMCASNLHLAAMQTQGWQKLDELKAFFPLRQFTLVGLEWTVIVAGQQTTNGALEEPFLALVIHNDSGDYQASCEQLGRGVGGG